MLRNEGKIIDSSLTFRVSCSKDGKFEQNKDF